MAKRSEHKRVKIQHPQRRGIVLLVIISLLVLFMLILVTFAVVSSHYRQAAQSFASRNYSGNLNARDEFESLDEVLNQILVGSSHPYSSLYGDSLLGDLYGNDGVRGQVNSTVPDANSNQILDKADYNEGTSPFTIFEYSGLTVLDGNSGNSISTINDYYAGNVITMLDGPCAGLSSRVVHYRPAQNFPAFNRDLSILRVEPFPSAGNQPQRGNRFVINGKPFNGTGLGRNSSTFANDDTQPFVVDNNGTPLTINIPRAFLPHLAGWNNVNDTIAALSGGQDEPWDTFDYQNVWLALQNAARTNMMASFVRPDLRTHLYQYSTQMMLPGPLSSPFDYYKIFEKPYGVDDIRGNADDNVDPWGKVTLANRDQIARLRLMSEFRPMRGFHPGLSINYQDVDSTPGIPDFTDLNSNGNYDFGEPPIYYYDVDNDNDGTKDSIWLDPGLPVLTAPNGRKYKRLVALMIRDLDGRINVNAHGNTEFLEDHHRPETPIDRLDPPATTPLPLAGNGAVGSRYFSRGFGYGPGEINFLNLFAGTNNLTMYRAFFQGTAGANGIPGRYGLDSAAILGDRRPGVAGPSGSIGYTNDPLALIKKQGYPLDYANTSTAASAFASHPDAWGRGALALDYAGNPYPIHLGEGVDWHTNDASGTTTDNTVEFVDDPYEVNLVDTNSGTDSIYTLAELERVLRRFDHDVNELPTRLYGLLDLRGTQSNGTVRGSQAANRAEMITTLSSHISTPRGGVLKYMRLTPDSSGNWGPSPHKNYAPSVSGTQPSGTTPSPVGATILDAARARIIHETWNGSNASQLTEAEINQVLRAVMPFELFQGQMFNVNRPFGNGVDDNGNGVVDEPSELWYDGVDNDADGTIDENDELTAAWTQGPFTNTVGGSAVNDDPVKNVYLGWNPPTSSNPQLFQMRDPRQLYARHLYCLARLVCDPLYAGTATQGTTAEQQRLYVRRIAQWAINAVDYRDADAIMTPFEFDTNPFNGWICDGNLTTNESKNDSQNYPEHDPSKNYFVNGLSAPGAQANDRDVVWGMEQQELVLTETLAFHDRGVRDTDLDNENFPAGTGQKKREHSTKPNFDNDLDQYKVPQGSLFCELKAVRAMLQTNPRIPSELYNTSTQQLDLSRLAPARPVGGGASFAHPVWRMVIGRNPNGVGNALEQSAQTTPDTSLFEQSKLDVNTNTRVIPERMVWFREMPVTNAPEMAAIPTLEIFTGRSGTQVGVTPGEYVVVGPRANTHIGALKQNDSDNNPATTTAADLDKIHKFTITGNVFASSGGQANDGFITYPPTSYQGNVKPNPVAIICAADAANTPAMGAFYPHSWPATRWVGMNISEPVSRGDNYYPAPINANIEAHGDFYAEDVNQPYDVNSNYTYDKPFDGDHASFPSPLNTDTNGGALANPLTESKTTTDFRTIFLQRLANPMLAWNPPSDDQDFGTYHDPARPVNPYITVDFMSIDLTVFSGEEDTTKPKFTNAMGNAPEDFDPEDPNPNNETVNFSSRERGESRKPGAMVTTTYVSNRDHQLNGAFQIDDILWSPRTTPPGKTVAIGGTDHYFDHKLQTARDPGNDKELLHTFGFINFSMGMPIVPNASTPPQYVGSPQTPVPWVTWQNRPFANAHELLLVPTCTMSRFGWEFQYFDPVTRFFEAKTNVADIYSSSTPVNQRGYYPYLMNALLGSKYPNTGSDVASTNDQGSDLIRLFDFMETPSPYVGAERWYKADANLATQAYGENFRPPFNRLSRFRDPGRININTIVEPEVLDALVSALGNPQDGTNFPVMNNLWSRFITSRRGYGPVDTTGNPNMFLQNSTTPTPSFFSNPFRPADTFDLMPTQQLKQQTDRPVHATLLRRDPATTTKCLWDQEFNAPQADDYRNTDRNAYFRMQSYSKLSNMVSYNSNTFAVWVTMGYFEVEPVQIDEAHPDGFALGQELGLDDGSNRRHRAFYLIDRSIPAAYEPGRVNNATNCVLLRRYVE